MRIVLSNEYGTQPHKVGAAHVAITTDAAAIKPESDRVMTFGGESTQKFLSNRLRKRFDHPKLPRNPSSERTGNA